MGTAASITPGWRRWGGVFARVTLGLIAGYIAYVPASALILFLRDGRVDGLLFLYGLLLPLQLPLLFLEEYREALQAEELLLQVFGTVFLVLGVLLALQSRKSDERGKRRI